MKRFISWLAIFILFPFSASGQEMLGVSTSNFSGLLGISINPSSMTGTKLYMDYNLISVSNSAGNNYAYWTGKDLSLFLKEGITPTYYTVVGETRDFTIFRNKTTKSGFLSNSILGPSGMVVYGRHAFAITTSFRSIGSFGNLPYDAALFLYEGLDYEPLQKILFQHDKKMSIATLQWFEAGFSYAYNFHRYRWNSWSAGITIKPLFGVSATYIFVDQADYYVHNDDSATVYSADFRYGYSVPLEYESNDLYWPPFFKGSGIAMDAGLTFWKTAVGHSSMVFTGICEPRFEPYNYKIGVSLIDLGFIRFSKEAEAFTFINASTEYFDPWDTLPGGNINEINAKIEYYFPDAVFEPQKESAFVMNLPTGINVQGDYHIKQAWYVNGMFFQQVPLSKNSIFRPSVLSVGLRYETPLMEIGFPVTFKAYDFTKPNIGFGFRYENFFIGSDNLIPMTRLANFTGFSIYAGLRLNLSPTFRMNYLKGLCDPLRHRDLEMFDYRNF